MSVVIKERVRTRTQSQTYVSIVDRSVLVQLSNLDLGVQRRVFVLLTRRRRHIFSLPLRTSNADNMKVIVKHWHAVAQWRWDIGTAEQEDADNDNEGDVCGICRVPYEGCCPSCKVPGDDCPLSAFPFIFYPREVN